MTFSLYCSDPIGHDARAAERLQAAARRVMEPKTDSPGHSPLSDGDEQAAIGIG